MDPAFSVRFQIFDKRQPLTSADKNKKVKLWDDIKSVARRVVEILGDRYIFMERCEAVIASADQRKQLRCNIALEFVEPDHFIEFIQNHSNSQENFSLTELKEICTVLQQELENYLGYSMDDPIIYVGLSSL